MSNNQGCFWWARNESKRFETKDATQIILIVLKEKKGEKKGYLLFFPKEISHLSVVFK